jgi:hypothetical protein
MTPCNGGGIITLLRRVEGQDKPQRLAYLMIRRDTPPMPNPAPESPSGGHTLDLEMYEFWSREHWEEIIGDADTCFGALIDAARRDEVYMSKFIRSPSGRTKVREFSLVDAVWTADLDGEDPWCRAGETKVNMPRRFTVSNALAGNPVDMPNPVVELKDNEQPIDDAQ